MKNQFGGPSVRTTVAAMLGLAALAGLAATPGCAADGAAGQGDHRLPEPAVALADPSAQPAAPPAAASPPAGAAADSVASAGPAALAPVRDPSQAASGGAVTSGLAAGRAGPIATVNGLTVPAAEVLQPLIEAHGLNMLLHVVKRDMARHGAETAKPPVVVTDADFKVERERTLAKLFQDADARIQEFIDKAEKDKKPDDLKRWTDERETEHKQLLQQLYDQKKITPTEFDLVIQTNTYLRKIAEPKVKESITEDMLHKQFAALYGEKLRVRHIELARPQDYWEIKRQLAAGRKFEDLARQFSIDPQTQALGGELPEFNREDPRLPKVFKEVAFDLKENQISDLVNVNDSFHLIKLEKRIMPKAIKYEDQRDSVYRDLHEQLVQGAVNVERAVITEQLRASLKINDPVMRKQLEEQLQETEQAIKSKEGAEQEMLKERDRRALLMKELMAKNAATRPTTGPAPVTQPAATRPAAPVAPAATNPIATQPPAPPPPLIPVVPANSPAATRPVVAPPAIPATAPAPTAPPALPPASRPAATQPAAARGVRAPAVAASAVMMPSPAPATRPVTVRPVP